MNVSRLQWNFFSVKTSWNFWQLLNQSGDPNRTIRMHIAKTFFLVVLETKWNSSMKVSLQRFMMLWGLLWCSFSLKVIFSWNSHFCFLWNFQVAARVDETAKSTWNGVGSRIVYKTVSNLIETALCLNIKLDQENELCV